MAITLRLWAVFGMLIFFLHALMVRCGYQTSAQMSATLWAVELNNSEGFYSSICWSKLQSFSFISKNRVNLWYIWFSNVHVQEHTHTHTTWKRLILLMKSLDDNSELTVELILHERMRKWSLIGSVFRFHSVLAQTTTVCVRTHFW